MDFHIDFDTFISIHAKPTDEPFVFSLPDGTYSISCDENGKTTVQFTPPEYLM